MPSVTWTFLRYIVSNRERSRVACQQLRALSDNNERVKEQHGVPNAQSPDVAGRLLLQKSANLLDLGAAAGGVEEQIAELAAVRLDINGTFGGSWIALED